MLKKIIAFVLMLLIVHTTSLAADRGRTYNRQKAVEYAFTYTKPEADGGSFTKYYNPEYAIYESDCTNFVSQVLHAGGWQYNPEPPPVTNKNWHYYKYSVFLKYWYHSKTGSGDTIDTRTWVKTDVLCELRMG